eukprot:CAMPEP_0179260808 /NCGR_PEP_ID=MMETSP0797-20121207/26530_1 /TAXON_ID=47934 /ORGANISM="Dinophysis acuminata, Strain DAEP01" /LENGTH=418 /DNA_ID=CAMNT_0020968899 /DNA_START=71 /DNA_END=1324 /DNA_ORIENTATION=-
MAGELGDAPPPFVTLEEAFASFAGGAEMDGSAFVKCLRGAGILDRSMTTVEADLIFAKHKRTGGRRINFQAFLAALRAVADRKAMPDDRVMELVCVAGGPSYSSGVTQQPDGTGPERFFYDESTYTGTHKTGRVSVPGEGHREFSDVVNRGHVLDDALQGGAGMPATGALAQGVALAKPPAPQDAGLARGHGPARPARGRRAAEQSPAAAGGVPGRTDTAGPAGPGAAAEAGLAGAADAGGSVGTVAAARGQPVGANTAPADAADAAHEPEGERAHDPPSPRAGEVLLRQEHLHRRARHGRADDSGRAAPREARVRDPAGGPQEGPAEAGGPHQPGLRARAVLLRQVHVHRRPQGGGPGRGRQGRGPLRHRPERDHPAGFVQRAQHFCPHVGARVWRRRLAAAPAPLLRAAPASAKSA